MISSQKRGRPKERHAVQVVQIESYNRNSIKDGGKASMGLCTTAAIRVAVEMTPGKTVGDSGTRGLDPAFSGSQKPSLVSAHVCLVPGPWLTSPEQRVRKNEPRRKRPVAV